MKDKRSQITIRGKTSDEKFKHLEVILRRMARRMNEKIVGIMPPSAIFQYVAKPDTNGILLRGIIPSGEITKICLAIRKYNTKKMVSFICSLRSLKGIGSHYTFETHKELLVESVNLSLNNIGFFTLKVISEEGIDSIIEDIWITVLLQIDQSDSKIKTLMLGELAKLEDLSERV
jgi:hypothetical protein